MSPRGPAVLVCEDGRTFDGQAYGAIGQTFGEAVFATGMTGYQETLTDPSYHRQVVVMTTPQVGNTGVNAADAESERVWVAGFVIRDPARLASSWRAEGSLEAYLVDHEVVGIAGVDTRALTRHLREHGAMRVGVFSAAAEGEDLPVPRAGDRLAQVLDSPGMLGADLTGDVTTREPYVVPALGTRRATVAAIDLGVKRMTPRRLAERGVEVHVLPARTSAETLLGAGPDGVFLSNGPGDPATAEHAVGLVRAAIEAGVPVFGICFGHQILGRALGLGTYKLRFGHRGINQPVADLTTGRVEITAHNHGFAVHAPQPQTPGPYGEVAVSHVGLNDGVVEGLVARDVPAFSVQYHPEAAAGPHDSTYLFDRFLQMMATRQPPGAPTRTAGWPPSDTGRP